jgi:glutamate racemase
MAATMTDGPVVVFDSGLGGLSVVRAIRQLMPDLPLIYVADDAAFPYGDMEAGALKAHICAVMDRIIARFEPSAVVIACNTASTLVLEPLRAAHHLPFVGTVPAIKPAAEQSRSGVISVLATPATIERDYTRDLIARFAGACHVRLVGAARLAAMAEEFMKGAALDRELLLDEVRPCFHEVGGQRTDIIVLACTHYPFLVKPMNAIAPWPVTWLDPAPAIARRLAQVIEGEPPRRNQPDPAVLTSGRGPDDAIARLFADYGFAADFGAGRF